MAKNDNLKDYLTDLADAIRAKKGTSGPINPQDFTSEIASIETGGGGGEERTVLFGDHTGAIQYEFTKEEFLGLAEMPKAKEIQGMTFQSWNWTLDRAKEYVSKYGFLNIGGSYITSDGRTRIYIDVIHPNGVEFSLFLNQSKASGVEINWGDGSDVESPSTSGNISITHRYDICGLYCITIEPKNNALFRFGHGYNKNIFGLSDSVDQNSGRTLALLKRIELGNGQTIIENGSLKNCFNLESINLIDGITLISPGALGGCTKLKSIILPKSLTTVNGDATLNNNNSEYISVNDGLVSLGSNTFSHCKIVKTVTLPETITSCQDGTLKYCDNLNTVIVPSGIMYGIGDEIMRDCPKIEEVYLPKNTDKIGASAFYECTALKKINANNIQNKIESQAFSMCRSLKEIELSDGLTTIGYQAFSYTGITKIHIPDTVVSLGSQCFLSCSELEDVHIPSGIDTMQGSTFSSCRSLRNIYIPNNVKTISDSVFSGCYSLAICDFSNHSSVPTLTSVTAFQSCDPNLGIYVPSRLFDEWCNATNWSTYKDNIKIGKEFITCVSLSITADDVSSRATRTNIYVNAIIDGFNNMNNKHFENESFEWVAVSEEFPQNTSYTDTVERVISYTYMGVTATTTITQGVWIDQSYTLDLNDGQWELSETIPNPDNTLYDGVYQSVKSKGVSYGYDTMYIDIVGYETFKLYIRSYAEGSYDYVMISQLDQTINGSTSYSNTTLVKAHTRGKQQSGTAIGNYTLVEFTGIDSGEHRITVVYRKDSSGNTADDRGYVLIPKVQ